MKRPLRLTRPSLHNVRQREMLAAPCASPRSVEADLETREARLIEQRQNLSMHRQSGWCFHAGQLVRA